MLRHVLTHIYAVLCYRIELVAMPSISARVGKSVRDIAAALGTSAKAAESMLTRARDAFRATFLALTKSLPVEPTA